MANAFQRWTLRGSLLVGRRTGFVLRQKWVLLRVDRFQYVGLMAACLVLTLPLEFALGARVWRRPKRLAMAVLPVLAVFTVWDLWATSRGTWGFNPKYTVGVTLPGGMAIEELLFFVAIPICTLLTLEAVRNMLAGSTPVQQRIHERARQR